jgi:hypothetical protein
VLIGSGISPGERGEDLLDFARSHNAEVQSVQSVLSLLRLRTRGWASAGEGELSKEVNVLGNNPQTIPNNDEFDCVEVRYGKSKCG